MTVAKRVIIDTDPGIDDTAAILFALGSPELQVDALTTVFGNVSVEKCTIERAAHIGGGWTREDIPVYPGSGRPFGMGEPAFAQYIHGSDGLGDSDAPEPTTSAQSRNAVMEIIDRVLESPGEITILAIGRLTNVALAINVEPSIVDAMAEVIVMGGAVTVPGNVTPVATANLWGDPQAADVVYKSGVKVVQVGLDVCRKVEFTPEQLAETWSADTRGTRLLQGRGCVHTAGVQPERATEQPGRRAVQRRSCGGVRDRPVAVHDAGSVRQGGASWRDDQGADRRRLRRPDGEPDEHVRCR